MIMRKAIDNVASEAENVSRSATKMEQEDAVDNTENATGHSTREALLKYVANRLLNKETLQRQDEIRHQIQKTIGQASLLQNAENRLSSINQQTSLQMHKTLSDLEELNKISYENSQDELSALSEVLKDAGSLRDIAPTLLNNYNTQNLPNQGGQIAQLGVQLCEMIRKEIQEQLAPLKQRIEQQIVAQLPPEPEESPPPHPQNE